MKLPTLTDDGRIYRHPELFRSAIEYTLRQKIYELQDDPDEQTFQNGAGEIVSEVYASGLDWDPIRTLYADAAYGFGLPCDQVDKFLAIAWSCAPHHPARWIEMTREWVSIIGTASIAHIGSGLTFDYWDFAAVCRQSVDDRDGELIHAFPDYLARVARLDRVAGATRGFSLVDGEPVFNLP